MILCYHVIADEADIVFCERNFGHALPHGCGWLRWGDDMWWTARYRLDDGTWIPEPYEETVP